MVCCFCLKTNFFAEIRYLQRFTTTKKAGTLQATRSGKPTLLKDNLKKNGSQLTGLIEIFEIDIFADNSTQS